MGRFRGVGLVEFVFGEVALVELIVRFVVTLRDELMEIFDDGALAMPIPLGYAMPVEDELDHIGNFGPGAVVGIVMLKKPDNVESSRVKLETGYSVGVLGRAVVSREVGRTVALFSIDGVGASELGFAPIIGFGADQWDRTWRAWLL